MEDFNTADDIKHKTHRPELDNIFEFDKELGEKLKLVNDPNPRADQEDKKIKLTWEDFNASFNSICP